MSGRAPTFVGSWFAICLGGDEVLDPIPRTWREVLDFLDYAELTADLLDRSDHAALRARVEGMAEPPTGAALLDLIAEHLAERYGTDPMELVR
jgi:hypothetical protein